MSNERDELARELFIGDNWKQPRKTSIQDWTWFHRAGKAQGQVEHYKTMADTVIAAGYRKPRTITTAEELDALADKTVFLDRFEYGMVMHPTLRGDKEYAEAVLPAKVLWEPQS